MKKVLSSVTAADWRVEAPRTRKELFWIKLDRSHASCKHPPATLNAREEVTAEMLCNGEGISPALAWPCSTAAVLLHKMCNKTGTCVCLWEPLESRTGAKREPQLLRIHRLLNSSPLSWWEYVPIRPQWAAGTDSPTTLSSPSADDYCLFSSGFYSSKSPVWPDEDVSLKVVLKKKKKK